MEIQDSGQPAQQNAPRTSGPSVDPTALRRAQGCPLGQIAGDSLGSLVEFRSSAEIRRRYPDGPCLLEDDGPLSPWHTLAGQPTDDSELALALARAIVATGGYDREAVAQAYVGWYRSAPFDCGTTIGHALGAVSGDDLQGNRVAARLLASASPTSQANGSLMRISPLGIWGHALPLDQLADLARDDSKLTHPQPICQESCAVFVVAVSRGIVGGAARSSVYQQTLDWATANGREPAVLATLRRAAAEPPGDYQRNQGWVLIALQNAFYQLLHAPSLEEGVVRTVVAGGDADTNAAIAGALLGAVHGLAAIPAQWREKVLACRPAAGLANVRRPRPEEYWPVDALELAAQLVHAGQETTV
ncbi:MAG TPA: ADP-ribosylglycohydrolase family protein [Chloroflexota bacterium]|nr:ADP-ribosylglycohydrolase family protein [Chloroflexota bacterium]